MARRGLLLAFALLGGSLVLLSCDYEPEAPGTVGAAAPAFEARDLEGSTVSLEGLREEGRVVLLNIWATWCPPCRDEMPDLQALQDEFGEEGLSVVGVSIDSSGSDEAVRRFLEEFGIDFLVLRDPDNQVSGAFAARGVPTTFLIDRDGVVRWRHLGPVTADDPRLRDALEGTLPSS